MNTSNKLEKIKKELLEKLQLKEISILELQLKCREILDEIENIHKIDTKINQDRCNHKDADGNFTVKYCDMYERRWSDLECTQYGKYINGFKLRKNEYEKEKNNEFTRTN